MHQSQNGHHAASLNGLLVKDKPQSSKEGAQDDSSQGGEDEEHHLKDQTLQCHFHHSKWIKMFKRI